MTSLELIGYCEIHCETPRALFHSDHINRMFILAGQDEQIPVDGFYSMHGTMATLCKLARERLDVPK